MTTAAEPVGSLIRQWRQRRHRSQLDLSLAAEVSARHLSFLETGRAQPSREMIERLCDELDVPLRDRNALYLAAGYAPAHTERALTDLGAARQAVQSVLTGLEPNPAVAVNVRWDLVAANRAAEAFLLGVPGPLRRPPVNMLRMTLHPDGMAARILNLAQWRTQALRRVRRQLDRTADAGLAALLTELDSYPAPERGRDQARAAADDLVIPLRLATEHGELTLLYTTTVFGSPQDVTLDEIAIETFFPADPVTAELFRTATTAG